MNYLLSAWNGSISIGFISCRPIKLEFNPKLNSIRLSSQTELFFWILWLQSYVEKFWVGKYSDFAYVLFMYWVARYHCEQKYVRFASKWFSSLKLFTIYYLSVELFIFLLLCDDWRRPKGYFFQYTYMLYFSALVRYYFNIIISLNRLIFCIHFYFHTQISKKKITDRILWLVTFQICNEYLFMIKIVWKLNWIDKILRLIAKKTKTTWKSIYYYRNKEN